MKTGTNTNMPFPTSVNSQRSRVRGSWPLFTYLRVVRRKTDIGSFKGGGGGRGPASVYCGTYFQDSS